MKYEYVCLTGWDHEDITAKVNHAITEGWELRGEVHVTFYTVPHDPRPCFLYTQALVKEVRDADTAA